MNEKFDVAYLDRRDVLAVMAREREREKLSLANDKGGENYLNNLVRIVFVSSDTTFPLPARPLFLSPVKNP